MKSFKDFLVIVMVALATSMTIFEIGAGSSPSDHHSSLVQLSALALPSSLPAQPESLAGSKSKQGAALQPETNIRDGRASQSATKSKNVAPAKSGARLTKDQLRAEVRKALPKLSTKEVDAAVWIIWKESTGRLYARNPRSTSHGLNGFISRSWVSITKRHGIKHSLEPRAQILALYHYCIDRYGSIGRAQSFHRRRGWY